MIKQIYLHSMLKKVLSYFLFFVFITPSVFEVIKTLEHHSHEECTEDGIHKHEIHIECSICSFNNINESTLLFYSCNDLNAKSIDTQSKGINQIVYLPSRFEICLRKRPPPSYIVLA